jgi:hypothetical protein
MRAEQIVKLTSWKYLKLRFDNKEAESGVIVSVVFIYTKSVSLIGQSMIINVLFISVM